MKPLLTAEEIQRAVDRLAADITQEYRGRPLTILGVLTGSLMLLADLVRRIDLPLRVGLVQASSYRGRSVTPGELEINASLIPDLTGRHVLLIDDIYDTGGTLAALVERLSRENIADLKSAVLLWKQGRSVVPVTPDYHCFQIPDAFVVGYGLDYNDEYRHLPYIAVLEPGDY